MAKRTPALSKAPKAAPKAQPKAAARPKPQSATKPKPKQAPKVPKRPNLPPPGMPMMQGGGNQDHPMMQMAQAGHPQAKAIMNGLANAVMPMGGGKPPKYGGM